MNEGKFDGGQLTESEKELRDFYKRLLNFTLNSEALMGKFQEIQSINRDKTTGYDPGLYSYVRWSNLEKLIIVANLSWVTTSNFVLKVPEEIIKSWNLQDGSYDITDQLYGSKTQLKVSEGKGTIAIQIKPSESFIFKL
jgi:hypothetical protein